MPPTVNNVTLCGRIGFVDQPVLLGNGYKALKLAIATSEVCSYLYFLTLRSADAWEWLKHCGTRSFSMVRAT